MSTTISEAYLAKHLAEVFDRIEKGSEAFDVERDGKVIARLESLEAEKHITLGEFIEHLRGIPKLDDGFARDVEAIRAAQPIATILEWPC